MTKAYFTLTTCLVALLGSSFVVSCAGDSNSGDAGPSPVEVLIQGISVQILQEVENFSTTTAALSASTTAFCAAPSEAGLQDVQTQWRASAVAWYQLQTFNFGPADADPVFPLYSFVDSLRLAGTDYTNSLRTTLEAWRTGDTELNRDFFAAQRFDDLGLLALELSLYDGDDLAATYASDSRRCAILDGLAQDLEERATAFKIGWTESYDDTGTPYVQLLLNAMLPSGREPLVQIVVAVQNYLDYLHRDHIIDIAGQLSNANWVLLEGAVNAIDEVCAADLEGGNMLYWMQQLGGADAASKLQTDLTAAHAAIAAQDATALETALSALDGDFKREVPDTLGIDLGLTLTDGD